MGRGQPVLSDPGAFLPDAIEVGSMVRAHRSEDANDPPLLVTSVILGQMGRLASTVKGYFLCFLLKKTRLFFASVVGVVCVGVVCFC